MTKTIILGLLLSMSIASDAQVPNFSEWFRQKKMQRKYLVEQIAALQVYTGYLKKGYEVANKGLTTISDIKNGTFNLDKDYFNSLKQVSPVIRRSPKVNEILNYQHSISKDFSSLKTSVREDQNLTIDEIRYIETVHQNMLSECAISLDALTSITTAGETEMTDDDRLSRLDGIHEDMQDKYAFTKDFITSVQLLSVQRRTASMQLQATKNFYIEN